MKKLTPILLTGLILVSATVFAQYNEPPQRNQETINGESFQREKPMQPLPLNAEQKTTVKTILSKYKASSLTVEDVKAIQDAFRRANIRRGPGLSETIKEAGFDPETLRSPESPLGRFGEDNRRKKVQPLNEEQLARVKTILSKNNITSLSEKDIRVLYNAFSEAGLIQGKDNYPHSPKTEGIKNRPNDVLPNSHRNDSQRFDQGTRLEENKSVSPDLQKQIKLILSRYNPSTLTAQDAKAIHKAFREAGIQMGPRFEETISKEGFKLETLRSLDPPPSAPGREE